MNPPIDSCFRKLPAGNTETVKIEGQNPRQEDVDALLAKELNQLSHQEREAIWEEMHGVERIIEETPKFLKDSMTAFEYELNHISKKPAYEQALILSKEYVTSPVFRLMWLRMEYFDAKKAATKMVNFLEHKLELFGPDALARPLRLSDLDSDDMNTLRSGVYQLLPARDSTGRVVMVDFRLVSPRHYRRTDNMLKVLLYIVSAAAEDEETQKRGFVGLAYYVGRNYYADNFDYDLTFRACKLIECIPIRFSGLHVCFDDPAFRAIKALSMTLMGRNLRQRLRWHEGTGMSSLVLCRILSCSTFLTIVPSDFSLI
jgi:hypothetical protein